MSFIHYIFGNFWSFWAQEIAWGGGKILPKIWENFKFHQRPQKISKFHQSVQNFTKTVAPKNEKSESVEDEKSEIRE